GKHRLIRCIITRINHQRPLPCLLNQLLNCCALPLQFPGHHFPDLFAFQDPKVGCKARGHLPHHLARPSSIPDGSGAIMEHDTRLLILDPDPLEPLGFFFEKITGRGEFPASLSLERQASGALPSVQAPISRSAHIDTLPQVSASSTADKAERHIRTPTETLQKPSKFGIQAYFFGLGPEAYQCSIKIQKQQDALRLSETSCNALPVFKKRAGLHYFCVVSFHPAGELARLRGAPEGAFWRQKVSALEPSQSHAVRLQSLRSFGPMTCP